MKDDCRRVYAKLSSDTIYAVVCIYTANDTNYEREYS